MKIKILNFSVYGSLILQFYTFSIFCTYALQVNNLEVECNTE